MNKENNMPKLTGYNKGSYKEKVYSDKCLLY